MDKLKPGDKAVITDIASDHPALASRMIALGLIPGEHVEVLRIAPLGDPMQVQVGEVLISVRRNDSRLVAVEPVQP